MLILIKLFKVEIQMRHGVLINCIAELSLDLALAFGDNFGFSLLELTLDFIVQILLLFLRD